jgi:hypothetical protein
MHVIPALRNLRQEYCEFEASETLSEKQKILAKVVTFPLPMPEA